MIPLDKTGWDELYRQGLSDREIARRVNCGNKAIAAWRRKNGLAPNNPAWRNSAEETERRMRLYRFGLNDVQIGKAVGREHTSIRDWRNVRGLPPNPLPRGRGRTRIIRLDAPLFETLDQHTRVADPAWSAWLERMGATVW